MPLSSLLVAEDLVGAIDGLPACLRLSPDASSVADFLHDESKVASRGVASVAVPRSVDELRRCLRWHAGREHGVVVSGSRTGLTGGAVPDEATHLVSLADLRGVLRVDADGPAPSATVLAGTWLSELNAYLAANHPGLGFPVDPTETTASLGGMVATNASGARSYRFGATRDWVEALTVELASGRTLSVRRGQYLAEGNALSLQDGDETRHVTLEAIPKPPTKNAIGYAFEPGGDALDLFIGAEGTLGVVSEVRVRLARRDESRIGFLQFFAGADRALAFVAALREEASLLTTAIEYLDARSHSLARGSGRPEAERVLRLAPDESCSVFAEVAYRGDEELSNVVDRLEGLVAAAGGDARASLAGTTPDELRDIVAFRHLVPERINALVAERRERIAGLHKIATDMAVTDADLRWVYSLYCDRLTREGLDFAIFGHAGDNHFHVNILPRDEHELARAKTVYLDFAQAVVERGGCVAAEHGIGRLKKAFLVVQYPEAVLATMRSIRRWADPGWRLNRGVLIDP